MEKGKGIVNYVVKYNSDPKLVTDNHKSNIIYLTDIDERGFDSIDDALIFLCECVNAITTVEELVPELKDLKKFKYILSEQNIKVKHAVTNLAETEIHNSDLDWG